MQAATELYAEKKKDPYIMVLKPDAEVGFHVRKLFLSNIVCDIQEMAWATAMQCRFTGHVRRRYSVAEHGPLVAELMTEPEIAERGGTRFEALMHDMHEGYISDLASPWKANVPDYRTLEHRFEAAMRKQFGLPEKISDGVKYADWVALFMEAEQLLAPDVTADWLEPEPGTRDYAVSLLKRRGTLYRIEGLDELAAYSRFMACYHQLKPAEL